MDDRVFFDLIPFGDRQNYGCSTCDNCSQPQGLGLNGGRKEPRMNHALTTILSLVAVAIFLVLGTPSGIAKPKIASGSECSSNWVNNAGAMQCFIQGEEESHNGVRHPHYVACTSAGCADAASDGLTISPSLLAGADE